MSFTTTIDGLLNNCITIEQPEKGFRVAVDTLLLAAAVPARKGEAALDLGCGVGGAMLALACRVPGVAVTGIELQPDLVRLCRANIQRNALPATLTAVEGDAAHLPSDFKSAFDHVLMNPPYHAAAEHSVPPLEGKRLANTEKEGALAAWLQSAALALKKNGILTLIHRADRLDAVTGTLGASFGALVIKPVITKPNAPPKRVLVRAVKGALQGQTVLPPLVLHESGGRYTPEADAILREMSPLPLRERIENLGKQA